MDHYLQVYVTVVEKGNFSRAADELHMTQPAVSQYIQALEREIGTRLLERNNKFVRMNKMGEIVYHHSKEILGLYTKMQRLIDDATNHASGPLAIGASYTYGEYVLPHILARMMHHYPLIIPSVTIGNTKEVAELVLTHQMDVGIVEGEFKNSKLEIEPFAEDEMYIVMAPSHPLAEQLSSLSPENLEEETWLVREPGSGTRGAVEEWFNQAGINPQKKLEFGSTQLIKEAVEAGLGVSFLSQWAIRKELSRGVLHAADAVGIPFKRKFSIVSQSPYKTKALATFIDFIQSHNSSIT